MRHGHGIANWLFQRFNVDAALAGDILEEYERGHSRIWYLRQVLAALCVAPWNSLSHHKLLAIRAVFVGLAAEWVICVIGWSLIEPLLARRIMTSPAWWVEGLSFVLVTQTAIGWVVARTHRAHQAAMLLTFLTCNLLLYAGTNLDGISRLVVDSIDQPRFRLYLAWQLALMFTQIAGNLVGGMLSPSPTAHGIMLPAADRDS